MCYTNEAGLEERKLTFGKTHTVEKGKKQRQRKTIPAAREDGTRYGEIKGKTKKPDSNSRTEWEQNSKEMPIKNEKCQDYFLQSERFFST